MSLAAFPLQQQQPRKTQIVQLKWYKMETAKFKKTAKNSNVNALMRCYFFRLIDTLVYCEGVMKTFLHLRVTDRDLWGHMTSSLQMQIQHYSRTKEVTKYFIK